MGRRRKAVAFDPLVTMHVDAWEYRTILLNNTTQWVAGNIGKPGGIKMGGAPVMGGPDLRAATNTYAHCNYRFAFEPRYRTRIPPDEDQVLQDYFYDYGPPKRFRYELTTSALHNVDAWRERFRRERAERRRDFNPKRAYELERKKKRCGTSTSPKQGTAE